MRVHLDTDFGGDPDDACALAMLLGWPGVELVGITTSLEHVGRRAGCVHDVLNLAGRSAIPVAAGAEVTLTGGRYEPTWSDRRHWPTPPAPRRGRPVAALDLLADNVAAGATVIAIGGFTNLALLELLRPGSLRDAQVVAMAGWLEPAATGLPQWGPETDFNSQVDTRALEIVAQSTSLTLVPLTVAIGAWLRRLHLDRLRATGTLGALLADQSDAHARDAGFAELAAAHPGLPTDLVNFHWDPVTCAVAVGWSSATVVERRLAVSVNERGVARFADDPSGRRHAVVTAIDGDAFGDVWLDAVARAAS